MDIDPKYYDEIRALIRTRKQREAAIVVGVCAVGYVLVLVIAALAELVRWVVQ
jgi:hypothetical protein